MIQIPIWVGIPAVQGGSQHRYRECGGHYHAPCEQTAHHGVEEVDYCGCVPTALRFVVAETPHDPELPYKSSSFDNDGGTDMVFLDHEVSLAQYSSFFGAVLFPRMWLLDF
jgi:hypothetical protein